MLFNTEEKRSSSHNCTVDIEVNGKKYRAYMQQIEFERFQKELEKEVISFEFKWS